MLPVTLAHRLHALATSRNSNSTLMSTATDVFVGLCYNAYRLVIIAIQKPVYVK